MDNTTGTAKEFLNVSGVAKMLATTDAAIRQSVLRRRIPHFKVNGRVLFDPQEIAQWVEKNRRTAPKARAKKEKRD